MTSNLTLAANERRMAFSYLGLAANWERWGEPETAAVRRAWAAECFRAEARLRREASIPVLDAHS